MEIVRLTLPFQSETTARRESVGEEDLRRFDSRRSPSGACGGRDDDDAEEFKGNTFDGADMLGAPAGNACGGRVDDGEAEEFKGEDFDGADMLARGGKTNLQIFCFAPRAGRPPTTPFPVLTLAFCWVGRVDHVVHRRAAHHRIDPLNDAANDHQRRGREWRAHPVLRAEARPNSADLPQGPLWHAVQAVDGSDGGRHSVARQALRGAVHPPPESALLCL
eukprot:scaffold410_cov125-Isochrysis_galbana.AAC.5